MKKYLFFVFLSLSQLAFSQKPMLCARIEGLWHFYDTNGKEMFEAHTAHATHPQGWVNDMVSVLQVVDAQLDSNQSIMPIFRRVLLDVKGNVVLEPKLKDSYRIAMPVDAEGYALIANQETGNFMLCDKKGEIVPLPTNVTSLSYKGEGMIEFVAREDSLEDYSNSLKTLYDLKQKKAVYKGKWYDMGMFQQGISIFSLVNENVGVINKKGEIIVPSIYKLPVENDDEAYALLNETKFEFIILKDSTDNYLIFNKIGKQIGEKSYAEKPVENNGFISVWDEEKAWSIIDAKGNTVAPTVWGSNQEREGFNSAKIAAITKEEVFGIINTKGELIVGFEKEYRYETASPTCIFLSKDGNKWDIFNAKGKIIRTLEADSIQPFGKFHYASFSLAGKNGLISDEGKVIIPLGNYSFSTICDDFFETKEEEGDEIKYQFWNTSGKMVLKNPIQDMGADWIIPVTPNQKYYVPF